MRKRLTPLLSALPESNQDWDFFFADAPFMLPGVGRVPIIDRPGGTIDFGGPAYKPDAPPEMIERVQKLEAGVRAMSLARAAEFEAFSEQLRAPEEKRNRADLEASRELAAQLMAKVGDAEVLSTADALLEGTAPSAKQGRWWLIRSEGNKGEWIGEEYCLKYLSDVLDTHGPFDACIGFSSGAMMGQIAQSLLCGAVPRSAEPTFTTQHPPFRWSLLFAPFVPYSPRYRDHIIKSGTRPNRLLIVAGQRDQIVDRNMAREFADMSRADALIEHPAGHVLPTDPVLCAQLARWIDSTAAQELGVNGQYRRVSLQPLAATIPQQPQAQPQQMQIQASSGPVGARL